MRRRRGTARTRAIFTLMVAVGIGWTAPGAAAGPRASGPLAQTQGPIPGRPVTIRGTVVALEGSRLRVATASGEQTVALVEPLTVTGATTARLSDITAGTFLGTAARWQADGTFRAIEVHIFAESMRGTGEGHRPMELAGTTMTNANVEAVVQRTEGSLLTLTHKDGETRVVVAPDTPIVRFGPGDRSLIVPGASIVLFRATRAEDGTVSVSRVTVGVNGTRLPL